jgi:PhnB protein
MKINPYLNFNGNAEEAFRFYQTVFGGELTLQKMSTLPIADGLSETEKNLTMHVSIPIGDGQHLMASDCLESQGQILHLGNNNYIALSSDSRAEADRIFNALSVDGLIEMPMADMFWGDYFGSFKDKFDVYWMVIYSDPNAISSMGDQTLNSIENQVVN